MPLSTDDLKNHTSKIIPEIDIKCSIAGELVPCLIAVPTYENDTCFNALLKVNNYLISLGPCCAVTVSAIEQRDTVLISSKNLASLITRHP